MFCKDVLFFDKSLSNDSNFEFLRKFYNRMKLAISNIEKKTQQILIGALLENNYTIHCKARVLLNCQYLICRFKNIFRKACRFACRGVLVSWGAFCWKWSYNVNDIKVINQPFLSVRCHSYTNKEYSGSWPCTVKLSSAEMKFWKLLVLDKTQKILAILEFSIEAATEVTRTLLS